MSKKTSLFLTVFCCVLLSANIAFVLVFIDAAKISQFSIPAAVLMLLCTTNAILSYILRHKGNFLYIGRIRPNVLSQDKEYTYAPEYERKFCIMLAIYCAAIPFYIPLIFLVSNWHQTLWSLLVFAAPQMVFIIQDVVGMAKDIKRYKEKTKQREQELKRQQQKEELGKFK